MPSIPTVQNIESITYQLLQESNDSTSIRGQMPVITIQFQDENSIVRTRVVGFTEMLPYIKMLHEKAIGLGEVLICDPESTFDKKIVITHGLPPSGETPQNMLITYEGDELEPGNELTAVLYSLSLTPSILTTLRSGSIFTIKIPVVNIDGWQNAKHDLNIIPDSGSAVLMGVTIDPGFYTLTIALNSQPSILTITRKPFISYQNFVEDADNNFTVGIPEPVLNDTFVRVLRDTNTCKTRFPDSNQLVINRIDAPPSDWVAVNLVQYNISNVVVRTTNINSITGTVGIDVHPQCVRMEITNA